MRIPWIGLVSLSKDVFRNIEGTFADVSAAHILYHDGNYFNAVSDGFRALNLFRLSSLGFHEVYVSLFCTD